MENDGYYECLICQTMDMRLEIRIQFYKKEKLSFTAENKTKKKLSTILPLIANSTAELLL